MRFFFALFYGVTEAILIQIKFAYAPPFPGQRRFPEGRGFKQWTGDDSKALMKVVYVLFSTNLL